MTIKKTDKKIKLRVVKKGACKVPKDKPALKKPDDTKITMSDPSAIPTGNGPEIDARIKKAQDEHRWVMVGREYSEEWQRILLLNVNGLKSISNLISKMGTDDMAMFFDGIDTQMRRLDAVREHMQKYDWVLGYKVITPGFYAVLSDCKSKLANALAHPTTDSVKTAANESLEALMVAMRNVGFEFDTVAQPIVGDKYIFKDEPLYVGTAVASAEASLDSVGV